MNAAAATKRVETALKALKRGELLVVTDDGDRENEGDLVIAAALAEPTKIAFMIRHTCGILCVPMPLADARRLKLDPMVARNDAPMGTAFTVSVDYKVGLTTGISATERCDTARALASHNAGADDFVRPGHVFPLIAQPGGVLMRSGHTEAAVDLLRLAELAPVGVLSELVHDDGTVMKGRAIEEFARAHDLVCLSVSDLIAYRQAREKLVERAGTFPLSTPIGPAKGTAFVTPFDQLQHVALIYGDIETVTPVPVCLHREAIIDDVFGDRRWLTEVQNIFQQQGAGVLVYLREGTVGVPQKDITGTHDHLSPAAQDAPPDDEAHASARERRRHWLEIGLGAQILRDLDIETIHLLASQERRYVGLDGFGVTIAKTTLIET